ncbi:tRNA pseudouridine(55) synthase TruB [Lachnospiraceae bacterium HCP1S3_C3]|nr:tRNA pseudouridine(55) synthase TruB [Lachnospiraceae bacterium]
MDGILNIYKEKGYTSHDVVAKLRGILKTKKIGHTGTLDPDAQGVLPVCVGRATKLCDMLTDKDKAYETVMLLGKTTDTQDITGSVLSESELGEDITTEKVTEVINSFVGEYMQVPPMYSALKVNGKKLYELARSGIEVERKARKVYIHSIEIKDISLPRVTMTVNCSKGTYIRTLCHDIGETLGVGGCMEELLRIKSGQFEINDSMKIDDVKKYVDDGRISDIMKPIDGVFEKYQKCVVKKEYNVLIYNGNKFSPPNVLNRTDAKDGEEVRVYDEDNFFIGIYRYNENEKKYVPVKMFLTGGSNETGKRN